MSCRTSVRLQNDESISHLEANKAADIAKLSRPRGSKSQSRPHHFQIDITQKGKRRETSGFIRPLTSVIPGNHSYHSNPPSDLSRAPSLLLNLQFQIFVKHSARENKNTHTVHVSPHYRGISPRSNNSYRWNFSTERYIYHGRLHIFVIYK